MPENQSLPAERTSYDYRQLLFPVEEVAVGMSVTQRLHKDGPDLTHLVSRQKHPTPAELFGPQLGGRNDAVACAGVCLV